MKKKYRGSLAEAFTLAVIDFEYDPIIRNSLAISSVTNLKLYRGMDSSFIINRTYDHRNWQMWTENKELAKIFAKGAGPGDVLELSYSGVCVDLEKIHLEILKDIEEDKIELDSVNAKELNEALDTYRQERESFILPPARYEILTQNKDSSIVHKVQ